jgi:hypothetical protein
MDLARASSVDAVDADFRAVLALDLDDFFEFQMERVEVPHEDKVAGGAALRYRVTVNLASRIFEQVLVDIALSLPPIQPELVEAPDLLEFAGVPRLRVLAIPAAWHVAEKVHAYTRRYGSDGARSSRPKDMIDIVLLQAHETFRAGDLRHALDETFDGRATHTLPKAFPPPPEEWAKPYAELADQVGLDRSLAVGYRRAGGFLDPILNGALADDVHWEVGSESWRSPTDDSPVIERPMTRSEALAMEGTQAIGEVPVDNGPE